MSTAQGPKRIAILTSGGDAPGMNAAVRAVTLVGLSHGREVFGVRNGYQGLVDGLFDTLVATDVLGIVRDGGTVLGSARCLDFHQQDVRDRARANLRQRGIEGLVVIGGNGSLTGALALSDPGETDEPPEVVGIPASIDNDLGLTSMAIGVDTAMNTIVEACDKIADTASAHRRTFLVEVMGRDCGYLAMTSAVAAGADMVLYPEAARTEEQVVGDIVKAVHAVGERDSRSKRVIVIKAEGVGVSCERLKEEVDRALADGPHDYPAEVRITVLGHVVRGGRPSAFDRLLGSRLGNVAVRALIGGQSRVMAAWLPPGDIPETVGARSSVDPYCYLVDLEAALEATRQLLDGESELARWRASVFDEMQQVFLL